MDSVNPVLQAAEHVPFWMGELPDGVCPPPVDVVPATVKWLIVGAGLAGCSVAYDLVQRGESPDAILLIDAVGPGWGATGRNAGFVLSNCGLDLPHWLKNWGEDGARELFRLAGKNRDLVRSFADEQGLWSQDGGSYYVCGDESERAAIASSAALVKEWTSEPWSWSDSCHEKFPYDCGYIHHQSDFGINSAQYLLALLGESGAPWTKGLVTKFRAEADRVVVTTSAGDAVAEKVILATNAYAPWVASKFECEYQIRGARNQVILAEFPGVEDNGLWGDGIYYAREGFEYWRQLPDGRLLLGGARNQDIDGESTWNFGNNDRVLRYLETDLLPKLSGGADANVTRRWSGILGFSDDDLPIVGRLPDTNGRVAFIVGFSGHGLGTHRIASEALTGLLLDDKFPGWLYVDRLKRTSKNWKG